jgi:hypothetical protein
MRRRASVVCKYFGDAETCAMAGSSFLSQINATGNKLSFLTERLGTCHFRNTLQNGAGAPTKTQCTGICQQRA